MASHKSGNDIGATGKKLVSL